MRWVLFMLVTLNSAAALADSPTHVGEWHAERVVWESTYFGERRADWQLDFATPLPATADIRLSDRAAWDGAARLELIRGDGDEIVGLRHHGTATTGEIVTSVPIDSPEPPMTIATVHRLYLRGVRIEQPRFPLEAHLTDVRHYRVTDEAIERFRAVGEEGRPIFVIPDAAYRESGGLQASIRRIDELSDERVTALGVGLIGGTVLLLVIGSRLSRRARREQLAA